MHTVFHTIPEMPMKTLLRGLIVVAAAVALTQLAACAYQQPYGQAANAQPSNPDTYQVYQAQPACANSMTSNSVVDAVVGGGLGGLAGNQFGSGHGKQAMTALGAVAGALAGQHVAAASRARCAGQ